MYELMTLLDELDALKKRVANGEQCQETIDRIFEIELWLDNECFTYFA